MPIHDWTRVESGLFHAFHQRWISALSDVLNGGLLPKDFFALPEQVAGGPIPDVLTLKLSADSGDTNDSLPGVAVATAPPRARVVKHSEASIYAKKADRLTIRHRRGQVIAVIEIVSPGNKSSRGALADFVEKSTTLIQQGIHLLIIDLFPPSKRDPQGIHKVIWDELEDDDFELPPDKPLTVVAYSSGTVKTAYVEPVAVGDPLPDMPLFLGPENYIPVPLEATYLTTWNLYPAPLKSLLNPRAE